MSVRKLLRYIPLLILLSLGFFSTTALGCLATKSLAGNASAVSSSSLSEFDRENFEQRTSEKLADIKNRILLSLPNPSSINSGSDASTIQIINLSAQRKKASIVTAQLQFILPVSNMFSYYSHPDGMHLDLSDQLEKTILFYPAELLETKPELSGLIDLVGSSYPDTDLDRVILAVGNDHFAEKVNECYIAIVRSDMQNKI